MTEQTDPVETGDAPSLEVLSGEGVASPEGQEQQPAAEQAETEQAQPEPKKSAAPKDGEGPKWFRDAIKARDDRARRAERERDEALARLDQGRPPQEQPDLSPEDRFAMQELAFNVRISERFARREHGQTFEEAKVWLETRPDIEAWAQRQPDPWEAAISLYKREKMAEEIGDNPDEWREKERARLREELMAEMQPQPTGMSGGAPRIPAPASTARSAPAKGGYAGPQPLSEIGKNRFG